MGIETIELVLTVALVLNAPALIALIMIQQGKGAGVGAAFGSGASQTMFGSAGATSFLTTMTTWLAVGFFVIAFGLAWSARERAEQLGTVGIPALEAEVPAALDVQIPAGDGLLEVPVDGDVPTLSVDAVPADADDVPALDAGGDVPAVDAAPESDEG